MLMNLPPNFRSIKAIPDLTSLFRCLISISTQYVQCETLSFILTLFFKIVALFQLMVIPFFQLSGQKNLGVILDPFLPLNAKRILLVLPSKYVQNQPLLTVSSASLRSEKQSSLAWLFQQPLTSLSVFTIGLSAAQLFSAWQPDWSFYQVISMNSSRHFPSYYSNMLSPSHLRVTAMTSPSAWN